MPKVDSYAAFKYHWLTWKFLGVKADEGVKGRLRFAYNTYALVLHAFVTLYVPLALIINCGINSSNLVDLCKNIYATISFVMCSLKFAIIFIVRKKIEVVRPILTKLDSRLCSAEEVSVVDGAIRTSHRLYKFFLAMFMLTSISGRFAACLSNERRLDYDAWYPFDWKNSFRNFVILNIYTSIALLVLSLENTCSDTYAAAYLTVLSAHIKALVLRINQIGAGENSKEHYRELVSCVKDHLVILELCRRIKEIISFTCFAQFISTGLAQCTVAIYLLYIELDYLRFFNVFGVFVMVTTETFVLCYYGDRFKTEYRKLGNAIYFSNWVGKDVQFQRAMLLFMVGTERDQVILAGNLIPVCLESFVMGLKTAYSIFAVLKELK